MKKIYQSPRVNTVSLLYSQLLLASGGPLQTIRKADIDDTETMRSSSVIFGDAGLTSGSDPFTNGQNTGMNRSREFDWED